MIDVACSAPHGVRSDYNGNWGADEYGYLSRYDDTMHGLKLCTIDP